METHSNKVKRREDALTVAQRFYSNTPLATKPIKRLGKESNYKTFVDEQKAKKKPQVEKPVKEKKEKRLRLCPKTIQVGQMYESGMKVAEISAKLGMRWTNTKSRLTTWEKYNEKIK